MARRRKSKRGGSKAPTQKPKEYRIMTLEEVRAREFKYGKMMVDLRACLHLVDAAYIKVERLKVAENILEIWNTYLRCDGLPKPYCPPEIRLFFVKLRFFESENIEKNIDWLLSTDERSILSQNIFRKDLTGRNLCNELRPNFGLEYQKIVSLALQVLKILEYYLEDEDQTKKASARVVKDIYEQKKAIHQEISEFFDRYTYRILSSEVSYMSSVDAITSEYFYECEDFRIHIWCLKNVPILYEFLEQANMSVDLHNLNISLKLPYSLLEDNLTLRGVHFKFDHFSEHAKSFFQEIKESTENLSAGITDLQECLINEWAMQVEIQNEVRNKMIQRRSEYDEKMQAMDEENKKKSQENKKDKSDIITEKGNKKKSPKKKPPKEPPLITEDTYPDIWDDFLEKEHKQYEDFINLVYHPNVLNLKDEEINLKRYSVLGGIYQMYFVKKPIHYNFKDFNMTWHEDNGNLVTEEKRAEVVYTQKLRKSRMSRMRTESIASFRQIEFTSPAAEYNESPLYVITFELPEFLCRWGEPLPCHYETDVVGFIENLLEEPTAKPPQQQAPVTVPSGEMPSTLLRTDVEPRDGFPLNPLLHPDNSMISQRSLRLFRQSTTSLNTQPRQTEDDTPIKMDDFDLDIPLMKYQIRHLQRHCLPRIISSLKFPIEIKDEEDEKNNNKPKGAGGTLIRKRISADELAPPKPNERRFSYDNQNNPERIFPYFPEPEEFNLPFKLNDYTDFIKESDPKTFSDLILALDRIKTLYLEEHECITKLPAFKLHPDYLRILFMRLKQTQIEVIEDTPSEKRSIIERKKSKGRKSNDNRSLPRKLMNQKDALRGRSSFHHIIIGEGEHRQSLEFPEVKEGIENSEPEEVEQEEDKEEKDTRKRFTFSHWTKEHISKYEYDKKNFKVTIWTDRLGIMGFAYKRYEHFPFRFWSVEPSEENPETEVVFTLETQYVKCVIFVTAAGFRGYVTEPTKKFVRNRLMYLVIEQPITDFKKLKKLFREKHLNIFSEHDARFYIENGYFSEKHLATEMHTYSCMAIHSLTMKFISSQWNRLAKRRDIVLIFAQYKEAAEHMLQARITPEDATFVEIMELCSNNLDVFNLQYTLTWRNIENYSDLHHLIVSINPAAIDMRVKDPKLICNLKNFLSEVRPLSYC